MQFGIGPGLSTNHGKEHGPIPSECVSLCVYTVCVQTDCTIWEQCVPFRLPPITFQTKLTLENRPIMLIATPREVKVPCAGLLQPADSTVLIMDNWLYSLLKLAYTDKAGFTHLLLFHDPRSANMLQRFGNDPFSCRCQRELGHNAENPTSYKSITCLSILPLPPVWITWNLNQIIISMHPCV